MAGVADLPVINIEPSRHSIITLDKEENLFDDINSYLKSDNNIENQLLDSQQLDYHIDINGKSIEEFFSRLEKDGSPAFKLDLSLKLDIDYMSEEITTPSKKGSSNKIVSRKKNFEYYEKNISVISSGTNKKRSEHIQYFYKQTEEISYSISKEHVSDFLRVREKIRSKYLYDFSIDFSFLTKFVKQSGLISDQNNKIFSDYVDITDNLIDKSPHITEEFFDRVDELLESAKKRFGSTISAFLSKLKISFGSDDEQLDKLKDNIVDKVNGFFDKLSGYFEKIETKPESLNNVQTEVQGRTEEKVADASDKIPTQ